MPLTFPKYVLKIMYITYKNNKFNDIDQFKALKHKLQVTTKIVQSCTYTIYRQEM